ncbi:MAG TPA: hypothetical protein VIM16_03975 [Mucilaginibacter sp.]
MDDNQLKFEIGMRVFLLRKYVIEVITLFIALTAVIISRYLGFLDNATVGALIGVIIGYAMSDMRKLHT